MAAPSDGNEYAITPTLHDYQQKLIEDLDARTATALRRVLAVMPTGSGKTMVAADIARRAVADGKRVAFIVHRRELIYQSSRKLHAAGLDHGIVAAGFAARPGEPVQICMVPTVHAKLSEIAAALIEAAAYILAGVPEPRRSQITTEARARLTKLMVAP